MNNTLRRFFLVLTLIIIYTTSNCQTIEGVIFDEKTREPISFVNIGIINMNIGTVSNEKGEFRLPFQNSNIKNIIGFSSIGYESIEMKVEDLILFLKKNDSEIYLKSKTYQIAELIVKPKVLKHIRVGNGSGSKRKKVGFGPDDKLGREFGTIISVKEKEGYMEKAMINIGVNNYGKTKLRLNIYSLENNMPKERINQEPIYFETEMKEGECIIDLEKYNIKVNNDFFISVEYIKDLGEYGLYFTFSFDKNPSFYRETSLSQWIESTYENRKISLGISVILGYEKN